MSQFNIADSTNALLENLEKMLTTKTVFGDAITIGDTTLIPVVDVTFGFGVGGGSGEDKSHGGGGGGGSGGGGRVMASAVIVIKGEQVQVMKIKESSNLAKLVDMVPGMVEKIKACREKDKPEEE